MKMPTPRRRSSNLVTGGAAGCAGAWAQETFRDNTTPAAPALDDNRNCLRFMESSGPRDSTTAPVSFAGVLDWALAAVLALAVLVFLVGVDIRLGGVTVRSHSAVRVIAVAAVLFLIRQRLGIASYPVWLTRIALLTLICGSVESWLRFLLATIGGADSYGYVSASQMLAGGRLIAPSPIAEWLSAPNRLALASPLGWTPSLDGTGIAPTFPIGV